MEKISTIYKITHKKSGKCYIGFHDNEDPSIRWNAHIKGWSNCDAINSALEKYGAKEFDFEIICQSKDTKYLLREMEPYFIKKYDSFGPNGYNMTEGGEGVLGYRHSEKPKLKLKKK